MAANIKLLDGNGQATIYEGIETMSFDTDAEGEKATFTHGTASTTSVELDFTKGDQVIVPEEGNLLIEVTVKKPVALVPENIPAGVDIGGVVGTRVDLIEQLIEGTIEELVLNNTMVSANALYKYGTGATLKRVEMPYVIEIDEYAFAYNTALVEVELPNLNVMSSRAGGGSHFRGCTALKSVNFLLLEGVVRAYAFYGCTSLTEFNCPNVTLISDSVFQGCTSLKKVVANLFSVGPSAFYGCTALVNIDLTDMNSSVASIGASAFRNCSKLATVDITGSPSSIGNYAFQGCSALHSFLIRGDSVPKMGSTTASYKPFYNLSNVYFYVPSDLVSAYKSDSYWSTYSSKIRALEDYYYTNTDYEGTNVVRTSMTYSTAESYSWVVDLKAGETVIITAAHRDSLTAPDDCQVFGSSNTIEVNTQLSFIVYTAEIDEMKTITVEVASSTYNNFNIVILKKVKSISYSGSYASKSASCNYSTPITAPTKPEGQALLWGLGMTYWSNYNGSWHTSVNDIIYITEAVKLANRAANFIDFGSGAVNRTFWPTRKMTTAYGALIDALELEFEET